MMPNYDPPFAADERTMLMTWLDYERRSVLHKVEGLTDEHATFKPTPGANSCLGIVYHLAIVEHWWFRECFKGEAEFPTPGWAAEGDEDFDFHSDGHITIADAIAAYRAEWQPADEIARAASLDDVSVHPRGKRDGITMRWILVHMIEETARHAGHLDITRELIDGSTGML